MRGRWCVNKTPEVPSHHLANDKHYHWKSPTQYGAGAGGRKGAGVQICLWWPYSFSQVLWVSLSLLYPLVCLPSSLFLPSSQVSSTLKGMSRCSTYTHLFSFCCHHLCMGPCQFLVLSCSFSFSHEILGKPILGKYADDTTYIYESVEFNHLFCFATVGNIQCQKYFWVLVLTVYIVSILPRTSLKFFSSSIIPGKPKIWLCIGEVKYMTKTRKKKAILSKWNESRT